MNRLFSTCLIAMLPALVAASEFQHDAEVISSEPITVSKSTDTMPEWCHTARPTTFEKLLRWDVQCSQPRTIKVTAYRVTYMLEGKHFSSITDAPPGDFIPVRITLEPMRPDWVAQHPSHQSNQQ